MGNSRPVIAKRRDMAGLSRCSRLYMQLLVFLSMQMCLKSVCCLKPVVGPVQVGNFKLSPVGCGTWSWGNVFLWSYKEENNPRLFETFQELTRKGINWFDTADSYGTGKIEGNSEKLLGKFANEVNSPKKLVYATKIAPFPTRLLLGKGTMNDAILQSRERLQRKIDILQFHWRPIVREEEFVKEFCRNIDDNNAVQLGVSNYGPKTLRQVNEYALKYGHKIHTNQVQFSLLSRYPLENGLTDICEELAIQPIAYSPLALGLLSDKYTVDRLPPGPRGLLFREYLPALTPLLSELRSLARERKKSVSQIALNYCLSKGFLVLVGMNTVEQARDNLGAVGWNLKAPEIDALEIAVKKCKKQFIQNANQSL